MKRRVKVFESFSETSLEKAINDWCNDNKAKIINASINVYAGGGAVYSAIIVYEFKGPPKIEEKKI